MNAQAPHVDLELEREVLGWALLTGFIEDLDGMGVTRATFYRRAHQVVWDAMHEVLADGGHCGFLTVGTVLRSSGRLEDVGAAYYSSLVDGAVAGPIKWQADRLNRLARARTVATSITAMTEALADPDSLDDGTIDLHLDMLSVLVTPTESKQIAAPERQYAALVAEARRDNSRNVPLGLPAIDAVIGGVRPGEVCGLMARTGTGKTFLLAHTVAEAVKANRLVAIFSLEMPLAQLQARVASMFYRVPSRVFWQRLRDGSLTAEQYAKDFAGLFVSDKAALSVPEMRAIVRAMKTRPALIVIDYLGLIGGNERVSTYERVSAQSRQLKDFAKGCEAGILLAIQVSREAGGLYGERELSLGSARDSGVIEEAMDYLVALRRCDRVPTLDVDERERVKDILFAKLVKNRHGRVIDDEVPYAVAAEQGMRLIEQAECRPPSLSSLTDIADFSAKRGRR